MERRKQVVLGKGVIPVEPIPKPRARFGRGNAYSSPQQREAEGTTAQYLRLAIKKPFEGDLTLYVEFYRSRPQVADLDNLVKLFKDAGNGIAWKDDRQINVLYAKRHKVKNVKEARTEYAIIRELPRTP